MRRLLALGAGACAVMVLWACVGDDGAVVPAAPTADGSVADSSPVTTPNDGATTPPDSAANVDAGPCDLAKPFGTPVALTPLNTGFVERSISLSEDEKTAYFLAGAKAMIAKRPSIDADFGAATPVPVVNDDATLSWLSVFVTRDGQVMYLAQGTRMYYATSSGGGDFSAPQEIMAPGAGGVVGTVFGEFAATNTDKSEVFFDHRAESKPGGLFHATILAPGDWNTVNSIDPLFDGKSDTAPVLSHDSLTLYFSGVRGSAPSKDVLASTRASLTGSWSAPALVDGVNSDEDDAPNWVSTDGCRMYLTSEAHGNEDLYVATRPH